ncbi:hypothetical protein ACFVVP_33580 [Streptomyces sp. NPDC058128]|uniref:hypothetical protein n=1 Tax=Streptomyces sp. NPDC058128 TaxID=3346352 RepID=UPI0036E4145B
MLHIRFTAEDMSRVRFAPRPSPVPELHAALLMLGAPHEGLLFGRWRGRLLRTLPGAAEPLGELVPGGAAPRFLDVLGGTREEGFALIRSARPEFVRSELARVYAGQGAVPPWVRALHRGDATAWDTLDRAQRAAHETVLAPVWPLVQDLHRAEFTRYALTAAEQGLAAALAAVAPGSRLRDGVWEWPSAPSAPSTRSALEAPEARDDPAARGAGAAREASEGPEPGEVGEPSKARKPAKPGKPARTSRPVPPVRSASAAGAWYCCRPSTGGAARWCRTWRTARWCWPTRRAAAFRPRRSPGGRGARTAAWRRPWAVRGPPCSGPSRNPVRRPTSPGARASATRRPPPTRRPSGRRA